MLAFLAVMLVVAVGGTWLTERIDRPRRRLEDAARRAGHAQ